MKQFTACIIIALTVTAALSYGDRGTVTVDGDASLIPRTQFKVPLANIGVGFNKASGKYNQVRVAFDESGELFIIAPKDDSHVKKNGETTVYRETQNSFLLSDFEAKTISRVCRTLVDALESYETFLKNEDWGRLAHLDSYFPRFLRGFHVMMCAAKDSPEALPRASRVRDEDYDVSLNSPKTDARINRWRTEKDQIMKLRIASKELAKQTKEWQKNELNSAKRDPEISYSAQFERTFNAFVKNYFGY